MRILKTIHETKKYLEQLRVEGKTIGLVPTMGYFHKGHLELMKGSIGRGHETIVSLFVNPTQFGPGEDLDNYPSELEKDFDLAKKTGVNAIFLPSNEEMYPEGYKTYVEVEDFSRLLCGVNRPTHFRGVTTVVLKLINIIRPNELFFGQKDGQQLIVIKKMLKDLNLDIAIEAVPIVREQDGLAMSSRNAYLSKEERDVAPILYKTLKSLEKLILKGERKATVLLDAAKSMILEEPLADLQYIEIRSTEDLSLIENLQGDFMIALAVKIGPARLIDNLIFK